MSSETWRNGPKGGAKYAVNSACVLGSTSHNWRFDASLEGGDPMRLIFAFLL